MTTTMTPEHYEIVQAYLQDIHAAIMQFHTDTTSKQLSPEDKVTASREVMAKIMWAKSHLCDTLQAIQYGEQNCGFRVFYYPIPD